MPKPSSALAAQEWLEPLVDGCCVHQQVALLGEGLAAAALPAADPAAPLFERGFVLVAHVVAELALTLRTEAALLADGRVCVRNVRAQFRVGGEAEHAIFAEAVRIRPRGGRCLGHREDGLREAEEERGVFGCFVREGPVQVNSAGAGGGFGFRLLQGAHRCRRRCGADGADIAAPCQTIVLGGHMVPQLAFGVERGGTGLAAIVDVSVRARPRMQAQVLGTDVPSQRALFSESCRTWGMVFALPTC